MSMQPPKPVAPSTRGFGSPKPPLAMDQAAEAKSGAMPAISASK